MKTFLKILIVSLSAVAALLIEICFLAYELVSAAVNVLLLGSENHRVRRQFKS